MHSTSLNPPKSYKGTQRILKDLGWLGLICGLCTKHFPLVGGFLYLRSESFISSPLCSTLALMTDAEQNNRYPWLVNMCLLAMWHLRELSENWIIGRRFYNFARTWSDAECFEINHFKQPLGKPKLVNKTRPIKVVLAETNIADGFYFRVLNC